jgi:ABC-type molybdate transport system ATPase subunit
MLLPLLITTVITILVDLDSPRQGLVVINQQSLIEMERTLHMPEERREDKT